MTTIHPLTSDHACSCGAPAVWATRRGPQCSDCTHPALIRIYRASLVMAVAS